jgi:hypothetical protein
MHPAKQGGTGGRARWAHIKIIKAYTFLPQFIGVRSFEIGVSMGIDIPISLIIGEDENNIGTFGNSQQGKKKE